jgi:hypothetical protein
MKKFKKGLIIGPSGIGEAHLREFLKYGIRNIGIIRKNLNKNKLTLNKALNIKRVKFNFLSNFTEIKKFKPDIISLCTPHYFHIKHIKMISDQYLAPIIVEKPFIINKSANFDKLQIISNSFFSQFKNKILVNLPMMEVAKQIKKKIKSKKISNINFFYFTRGRHEYDQIIIDLLPHAIAFILSTINQKLSRFEIIKQQLGKSYFRINILINGVKCFFNFKQNIENKSSSFLFEIDSQKFERVLLKNSKEDKVSFNIDGRNHKIKNPMSVSLRKSIKTLNNNESNKFNKDMVNSITKITCHVLNNLTKSSRK